MDKYFVDSHTRGRCKELVSIDDNLGAHFVSEVLTHLYHIHTNDFGFKKAQEGHPDAEDSLPALEEEHVEDRSDQAVRQEAGEDCHEPLGGKIVWCQLNIAHVLEEPRHVELDQLSDLEVLS